MRTTVTLDPDTEALIRKRMQVQGVSFKQAINDAIREGLASPTRRARFRTRTADLGLPVVALDRALQLAAELEDEEIIRRMRSGK
ncbi:MAG: antitoxin [Acidimicrobiales bacterium]